MKRLPLAFFCVALSLSAVCAADHTQDVQTELKSQGFYFGEVDGQKSKEFSAAIRRYQIRNGLETSGEVDAALLESLGIGVPAPAPAEEPVPPPAQPAPPPVPRAEPRNEPPVNLRRNETVEESDRRVLRQETQRIPRDPNVVSPPQPLEPEDAAPPNRAEPDPTYSDVFAGTPYRTAPAEVQADTLRRAQRTLAGRGLYREPIDGIPGPATEEAILSYQRSSRLPMTGRLDLPTLNALRLLPGRGPGNPPLKPFTNPGRSSKPGTIRGVWVE